MPNTRLRRLLKKKIVRLDLFPPQYYEEKGLLNVIL
jgi:hypothetical protein